MYTIASVTKQFTSAAVLRSILDFNCKGDIECLDKEIHKPIINFIKEDDEVWDNKPNPDWANKVSLHNLLSHTSGLNDGNLQDHYTKFIKIPRTKTELMEFYIKANQNLSFEADAKYEYANVNFFLAGLIVERISGTKLSQYFKSAFFIPLGMDNSLFPDKGDVNFLSKEYVKLAFGYTFSITDGKITPNNDYFLAENNQGEGGIISTVGDLIKWNYYLFETEKILPQAVKNIMLKPVISTGETNRYYAYGIETNHEKSLYTHDGHIPGYYTRLYYDVKNKVTFVQVRNITQSLEQTIEYLDQKNVIDKIANEENKQEQEKILDDKYPYFNEMNQKYNMINSEQINNLLEKCKI